MLWLCCYLSPWRAVILRVGLPATLGLLTESAQAHVQGPDETQIFSGWGLVILLWLGYCIGARRVPPVPRRALMFQGASLIVILTLFGSGNDWFPGGSAMHMIEHLLIMTVIAPLFVLARPLPQWVAASGRAGILVWKPLLRLGRHPLRTASLQALVLWLWHAPKFYNLALSSPGWHLVEHLCFALSAGIFWWSILARPTAAGLPALLLTLMHTGMLGALLTFTSAPLYQDSHDLQDQQLAGLIMWVPGGLPYLIAGGWCSLRWFRRLSRKSKGQSLPHGPAQ
jgi:putative membrane protein